MTVGIYELRFPDGSVYIGQSINIEKRFNAHKRALNDNTHHNKLVQNKYNELGLPAHNILEVCTKDNIYQQEVHYAKLVPKNLLLNLSEPGQISTILNGELNGRSKYSNDNVVDVMLALANTDIRKKDLAEISPISYSTIRQIGSGSTHKWLKESYPVEYELMLSKIKKKITHKVMAPDGTVHEVISVRTFENTHNISSSSISRLLSKKASSVKGWTLVE